jgi:hypothetical protein
MLAESAMRDIWSRGKIPSLPAGQVAVDSLLYDMQLGSPVDQDYRSELNSKQSRAARNYKITTLEDARKL